MSNTNLLLRALRMNAIFSAASAILLIPAGTWVAAQLGLPNAIPVYVTSGILAVFALQLGNIVRTREIRSWEIASIIGADIAWVAGSLVLVALFYRSMSTAGLLLVDLVAIAVLFFAIQQLRGLKAFRASPR